MAKKKIDLKRLFSDLNTTLFVGALPDYRVVFSSQIGGTENGYCDTKKRVIQLAEALADDPALLRRALVHEMCHHGCPGHGKAFLAKLDRLAAMGEEWASEEAEEYRKKAMPWNDLMHAMKQQLEECAASSIRYSKPKSFKTIRSLVCSQLHLSAKDVDKKLPWLRASWKNALEQARKDEKVRKVVQQKAKALPKHLLDPRGKIRPTQRALKSVRRQHSDLAEAEQYRLAQAQTLIDWKSGVER